MRATATAARVRGKGKRSPMFESLSDKLQSVFGKLNSHGTVTEKDLGDAMRERVAFVPGAPFYACDPQCNTLRLNFSNRPPALTAEGLGRLGACLAPRLAHARPQAAVAAILSTPHWTAPVPATTHAPYAVFDDAS